MDLKDLLLQSARPVPESVAGPGLPDGLYIRVMSSRERDAFDSENYKYDATDKSVKLNRDNTRARLLVRCLCNSEGDRVFTDGDADKVGELSANIIDPLFERAQKINKLTSESVDEAAKN